MKLCIPLLLNQILFSHTHKPPRYHLFWMWWLGPPLTPLTLLTNSFLRWEAVRNVCTWTKALLSLTQNNMELQFLATALCCRDQPWFSALTASGSIPLCELTLIKPSQGTLYTKVFCWLVFLQQSFLLICLLSSTRTKKHTGDRHQPQTLPLSFITQLQHTELSSALRTTCPQPHIMACMARYVF